MYMMTILMVIVCLQCFDTVDLASGRASGLQKIYVMGCWHGYLSAARSNGLHMVQLMPLPPNQFASLKSRMFPSFWWWLEKGC